MDNISLIKNHVEVVDTTSLHQICDNIKAGTGNLKEKVQEIRQSIEVGSAEHANQLKKELPGFTCSGIFKKRRTTSNLTAYSGLIILDLDKLCPSEVGSIKEVIKSIPFTRVVFISPSGLGLKVIVKIDSPQEQHKEAYQIVKKYYEEEIGHTFDKTSDVARLTYFSYDPEIYVNSESVVFAVKDKILLSALPIAPKNPSCVGIDDALFIKALAYTEKHQKFVEGNRNNFIHQLACNANRYGVTAPFLINSCIDKYAEGWCEKEIQSIISGVYNRQTNEHGRWGKYLHKSESCIVVEEANAQAEVSDPETIETPLIPDAIIEGMPDIIKNIALKLTTKRERDVFVTGAISVLSGCFSNVKGVYDGSVVYPSLYSFNVAPASSGKGVLKLARDLCYPLHKKLLDSSIEAQKRYEKEMNDFRNNKGEGDKPEKPPFVALFVPGNSSSASIYEHLNECNGIGIVCETEADTISACLNNDWGNYSDLLRKSFHHEPLSLRRKTDKLYIDVSEPRLSVAISGTPSQIIALIHSAENGLFSRFLFYRFQCSGKWRDVSPANGKGELPSLIKTKGEELIKMVERLNASPTVMELTEKQWESLNQQFIKWLNDVSCFVTEEAGATVKRLGLIVFRIAMVFSALDKSENRSSEQKIVCSDKHFEMALQLAEVYLQHSLCVYRELQGASKTIDKKLLQFFNGLPDEFTRDMAQESFKGTELKGSTSWIDKSLKRLIEYNYIVKPDYNVYRKISGKDDKGSSGIVTEMKSVKIEAA